MDFEVIFSTYSYVYDRQKAKKLLKERNIDIQKLILLMKKGKICAILDNPNYLEQFYVVVKYKFEEYYPVVIAVKVLEAKKEIIIKTAFPNRKFKDLIDNC